MVIGRPLSFDREQTLDRVVEVFRERGFEGASLQDLLAATGLSKSSLYQQYGNKQALFEQCLDSYAHRVEAEMRAALNRAPDTRAFVALVLGQIINEPRPPKGCLVFNTAIEFGQLDERVAGKVRQVFASFRSIFVEAIERDRAAGRLPAGAPAPDLANFLMASMSGLRTLVKGGMARAELRRSCELILKTLG